MILSPLRFVVAIVACVPMASLHAADTWNNGGGDSAWTTSGNWSAGVPTTSTDVQIGTQPSGNIIGVNTSQPTTVASFTFNSTLTASVLVRPATEETLQIDGAITNLSSSTQRFAIAIDSGANATYTGGSAGLAFDQLVVGLDDINTTGLVDISGGLTFTLNSLASYGQIGSVDVAGATINIGGSYTGNYGDTFDLTSGNFASATLGSLPSLSTGLFWDTSDFLTDGVIEVVPEPSFFALLTMGLGFLAVGALAKKRFGASLR